MGGTGRPLLLAAVLLVGLAAGCADGGDEGSEPLDARGVPATDDPIDGAVGEQLRLTAACPTTEDSLGTVAWTVRSATGGTVDRGPHLVDEYGQASLELPVDAVGEHRVEAQCLLDDRPVGDELVWTIRASEPSLVERVVDPWVPQEAGGADGPLDDREDGPLGDGGGPASPEKGSQPGSTDDEPADEEDPDRGDGEDRYRDRPTRVPADTDEEQGDHKKDNGADFHGPKEGEEVGLFGGGGGSGGHDDDDGGAGAEASTVTPIDDTTVRSADPNATAGDDPTLATANTTNATSHTLLAFDLTQLTSPTADDSVCLTLRSQTTSTIHRIALRPYHDTNWTENTATWNDLSTSAIGEPLATREVDSATNVSWNVTDPVLDAGSEAEIAFLLTQENQTTDAQTWTAKEGEEPPKLSLDETGCPTPDEDEQPDPQPETAPTDDTTVRSAQPNATAGDDPTLATANTTNDTSYTLLAFDLAQLATPAADDSVCLTLRSQTASTTHRIALHPYHDTNWTEHELTWNELSPPAVGDAVDVREVDGEGNVSWNVTDPVLDAGSKAEIAFLLTQENQTTDAQTWTAKEGDQPPKLSLDETGCPTPDDEVDEPDPQPQPETAPTDDTTVTSDMPDRTHGDAQSLSSANGTDRVHHAVLKFDLAELQDPEESSVCLTIRSHAANGERTSRIALRPYHDTDWTEHELTWNDLSQAAIGDPLGVHEVGSDETETWNVTGPVTARGSEAELAFVLSKEDHGRGAHVWEAKEGGQAPQLSLSEKGCEDEEPDPGGSSPSGPPLAAQLAAERWTDREPSVDASLSVR